MNRNTFFTTLIAMLAAPFAWAAGKVRADQLTPGATGTLRLLAVGSDNRFASLAIGSGLTYDGTNISATPPAAATPVLLTRNPDGTYLYTGGAVFRNGLIQIPGADYTVAGSVLTPIGWNADDVVVRM
jgi:hypothetical protein